MSSYRICPNRSTVRECKGLGVHKACHLVPTTVVLCIFRSSDVHMCVSQTDWNITRIWPFLNDFLMFYQAFGVNLSFDRCGMFVAGGACVFIRYRASNRSYTVSVLNAKHMCTMGQWDMIGMYRGLS